jgi:hypothetical protein
MDVFGIEKAERRISARGSRVNEEKKRVTPSLCFTQDCDEIPIRRYLRCDILRTGVYPRGSRRGARG